MSEHFPLGGSNAHRWCACPASISVERGFPDVTSPEAQEGTFAHLLLEVSLLTGKAPHDFIGLTYAELLRELPHD